MRALRDRLIEPANPASYSSRLRARRWQEFLDRFPDLTDLRVLDLGGVPRFWRAASIHPAHVTLVNLRPFPEPDEPWMRIHVGDACAGLYPDGPYDLVVSNSVLEHVGGAEQRQRLADVIDGAAERHWVQTPNRYFPIEPHWLFPGFQFLPFGARVAVTRAWPLGHRHSRDRREAARMVAEVELIGPGEMRRLFPRSTIWFERLAGMPKSIVAIRS